MRSESSNSLGAEIERKFQSLKNDDKKLFVELQNIKKDIESNGTQTENNRENIRDILKTLERIEENLKPWYETHIMFKQAGKVVTYLTVIIVGVLTVFGSIKSGIFKW